MKSCKHCGTIENLRTNKNGGIYNCCVSCYKTIEVPYQMEQTNLALKAKYGVASFGELKKLKAAQTPKKEKPKKICKYCGSDNIVKKGKYNYDCCELHWQQFQDDARKKRLATNKERFGIENHMQVKEIKEKFRNSIVEKYGCEYPTQNQEVIKKRNTANFKKYGNICPTNNEEVRKKSKQTCLEKYGVDNPLKSKEIQDKIRATLVEKYGVDNPLQSEEVKNKIKKTNLERYGVEYGINSEEIRDKARKTRRFHYWDTFVLLLKAKYLEPLFSREDYVNSMDKLKYKCIMCNKEFEAEGTEAEGTEPQRIGCECHRRRSSYEYEIEQWLKSNRVENIELNKRFRVGQQTFEIDVFLPDFNLGIDFHGLYYHSEIILRDNYHQEKCLFFKELNIQIIQIFENEWVTKQHIVKSIIFSKLNKNDRVYARECEIKLISSEEYKSFVELNHIQGFAPANKIIGLFYNNKLVCIGAFGENRFSDSKNSYELIRFASLINLSVVGGFQRILSFFEKEYPCKDIISFINLRYFNGNSYTKSNFTIEHLTKPNYFYFKRNEYEVIYNRIHFQKHKLEGLLESFDPTKSEHENMLRNDYLRIFDAGNLKVIKKLL